MEYSQTKFEAVAHYLRMMFWVMYESEAKLERIPSFIRMRRGVNENWHGAYCSYCLKNHSKNPCLLNTHDEICDGGECCAHTWDILNNSNTWREWLHNARKVLDYIIEHGD